MPTVDDEIGVGEVGQQTHELFPLKGLDAFVDGLFGVVIADGHGVLGDDRARVDAGVDEVDGPAGQLQIGRSHV